MYGYRKIDTATEDTAREEGEFKVYINERETERIHKWVELMPDIKTGKGY